MLAKIVKNSASVAPFVLREIGDASENAAHGVAASFDFPAVVALPQIETSESPQPDFDLENVAETADNLIRQAQQEAARIVASAEANSAMIEEAARERGLQQAKEIAGAEIAAAVADLRGNLSATIEEISNLYAAIAAQAEEDLVNLSLEIAKKVVQREVSVDREIALTLARVTLERTNGNTYAEVRLSPDDFAYVSANQERLNFSGSLELIEDRSIAPGGCLIKTEVGDLDARIDQLFDEISRGLLHKN